MNKNEFPSGKLAPDALVRSVLGYTGAKRRELLVGPAVGEDAAVIDWPCGKYMVFASDPIVGAEKGAGRLLVRVNSNDIASKGGDPAFLAVTLILSPAMGEEGAASIMKEIHEECVLQKIAVAGGHTEFNDRYDRPVMMGALIGMADRVMRASDIKTGDAILITKHIGIEGMSILAADRPDILLPFMTHREIEEVLSWQNSISVLPDSRCVRHMAKFMHDPTEGGFTGGIWEICALSGLKAELDYSAVPLHPLTKRASEHLGFDPLCLIASGSLLAVVSKEDVDSAKQILKDNGIASVVVGHMGETLSESLPNPKEELWGLLKRNAGDIVKL